MRPTKFIALLSILVGQAFTLTAAHADPISVDAIAGRWRGLRTIPGTTVVAQNEVLVFAKDGSYISEAPYYFKARYKIAGDKIVLTDARELTYTNGSLVGYMSVYVKVRP